LILCPLTLAFDNQFYCSNANTIKQIMGCYWSKRYQADGCCGTITFSCDFDTLEQAAYYCMTQDRTLGPITNFWIRDNHNKGSIVIKGNCVTAELKAAVQKIDRV